MPLVEGDYDLLM